MKRLNKNSDFTGKKQFPLAEEFFQFFFDYKEDHLVYKWLLLQQGYVKAEQRFCQSKYYTVTLMESAQAFDLEWGKRWTEDDFNDHLQQTRFDERLQFARTISLCFWHYFVEEQSVLWVDGDARKKRKSAEATYRKALNFLKQGFGPHADGSRAELQALLTETVNAVSGDGVPTAYRVKAGSHRPATVLIRELATCFHTSYSEYFPTSISDLVNILKPVEDRTIERQIEYLQEIK